MKTLLKNIHTLVTCDDADRVLHHIDVLFDGEAFHEFRAPKLGDRYVSGAGCTLAAAITAELAKGTDVPEAVRIAKDVVTRAIENRITPHTPFDEVFQA